MKVVMHDRTERVPPLLRSYAEHKLDRLTRHFDRVLEAEVHFDVENRGSREPVTVCRILVRANGRRTPLLKSEESAAEERAALDLALDKIDRQVVRLKERRKARRALPPAVAATATPEAEAEPAVPELDMVRRHVKPESVEQARAKLDSNGMQFHLFVNEDSGEVNVIYRRPDGGVRVIEPILK